MITTTKPLYYVGDAKVAVWKDPDKSLAMEVVPAISIAQPWASWIAMHWKTVETRSRNRFDSLCGRRVAIHASKTWDKAALDVAGEFLAPEQISRHGHLVAAGAYPAGEIVAVARLEQVRPVQDYRVAASALCPVDGLVGYRLEDIEAMPAGIRVAGSLSVFYVDLPSLWVRQLPLPVEASQ